MVKVAEQYTQPLCQIVAARTTGVVKRSHVLKVCVLALPLPLKSYSSAEERPHGRPASEVRVHHGPFVEDRK